jgi:glycosyltransferase involved in cell wall biosynthesis
VNISVVVLVFKSRELLSECLDALLAASQADVEIIVADDSSTDRTPLMAAAYRRVKVVRMDHNSGSAAARNRGAREAGGSILFFVDADVVVARDSVEGSPHLRGHPDVAAGFDSNDARLPAKGIVSQYRNLLHHFVHQHGNREASTFWAGCGAMRRPVFEALPISLDRGHRGWLPGPAGRPSDPSRQAVAGDVPEALDADLGH